MSVEGLARLINWATENGAHIDPSIKWEYSPEKGVYAIYDSSEPNDTATKLLQVPQDVTITPDLAVQVFGDIVTKGHRNSLTQLLLAKLRFDSKDTVIGSKNLSEFFKPYIQILPSGRGIGSPLFWDGDERDLIRGTDAYLSIDTQTKLILEEWYTVVNSLDKTILPEQIEEDLSFYITLKEGKSHHFASYSNNPISWTSFPAYLWAHATFTSRAFPYFLGNSKARDLNEAFLLPIIDLLNHDNDASVKWDAETVGGSRVYSFKTNQTLTKGIEISNSYGPKTNVDLLFGYGFVLQNNPHETAILSLKIPDDSVEGAAKYGVAITSSAISFALTKDNLLPENLVKLFTYLVSIPTETSPVLRSRLEGYRQLARIFTGKVETLKDVKSTGSFEVKIIKAAQLFRNSQKQIFQLAFEEITKKEKELLKKYKPLSFKTVFKNDKAFADSLLLMFGIQDNDLLAKSDEVDRALLLWIIRVGNKKHYKEKTILPDWINQGYQTILQNLVVTKEDVKEYAPIHKAFFPVISQKIPEIYSKGDWTIRSFIAASKLIEQISFTREVNNEVFLIEDIKL